MFRDLTYDIWYGTSMSRLPTSAQSGQRLDYCFTCSNPRRPWRKSCVGKDAGPLERPWTCFCSLESLWDVKSGTKYVNMLHSQVSSAPKAVAVSRFSFSTAVLHKLSCTSPWSPPFDAAPASLPFIACRTDECHLFFSECEHCFDICFLLSEVYITQLRRNAMGVGLVFEANLHTKEPATWCLSVDRSGV